MAYYLPDINRRNLDFSKKQEDAGNFLIFSF